MALYNKYRPKNLRQVCGQDHVRRILANQVKSNSLSHAYLFVGPAGTGKTTIARILCAMVNCSTGSCVIPPESDPNVSEIFSGTNGSDVIEMDAATNSGVTNIREMRDSMQLSPMTMRKKIYIMDECHRFSTEAWEALLKTIEEPPPHLMFIFATTDDDKIPETIKTRCMCLDFKRLLPKDIAPYLGKICEAEQLVADPEALHLIAATCDGGLRRALSMLEAVSAQGKVTEEAAKSLLGMTSSKSIREFIGSIISSKFSDGMRISSECLSKGVSVEDFLVGLAEQLYYVIMSTVKEHELSYLSEEDQEGVKALASGLVGILGTDRAMRVFTYNAIEEIQRNQQKTVFKIHPQHWVNYTWLVLNGQLARAQKGEKPRSEPSA